MHELIMLVITFVNVLDDGDGDLDVDKMNTNWKNKWQT